MTCEEIVHWLDDQRDDPDPWHDGYHRTIAVVIATDQANAREAHRRVWGALGLRWKGERENELCTMRCNAPAHGERYRFDRTHWRQVLEAGGRTAPAIGAVHAALAHQQWTEPKVIAMVDADHLARGPQRQWTIDSTGDWIRTLSDQTRVRQVLFGTDVIASAVFSSAHSAARSRAFRVDLEKG